MPFPFAADDHQTHNARAFSDHGAAVLIQQADLTVQKVHDFVHGTVLLPESRTAMERAMRALSRPDAAADIARTILCE